MKVSREQAEQNRQKVLQAAGQLFRKNGIDGVGVAELMQAVGLTHGGFYGQFASKDDLVLQATADALSRSVEDWTQLIAEEEDPWTAIKETYLSRLHCQYPEAGCALTALAVEGPRRGRPLQAVLTHGLRSLVAKLEAVMPRKRGKTPREQAVFAFSAMVGAVILARAVDDDALADELLATARRGL